ncbi:hypothetical protein SteCoe_4280 [Stentor coeruleus]|uniref:Uncharacterized protein n=1 Tax=Stentor coeruleus TaxID=5963 RepID=A0A1R2CV14_9CILI|nr:hypothetical protein SteCoe_4280 [Stentor coeruleus]
MQGDEEIILPITMENSVVFKYDEKLKNFDFDSGKIKAQEIIGDKLSTLEFEDDFDELKEKCAKANPPISLKIWVFFCAAAGITTITMLLLIVWVILILDIVILAAELCVLRKLKHLAWRWKNGKVDKVWSEKIYNILILLNDRYTHIGLIWKFDPENKWMQLTTYKRPESSILF